MTPDKVQARKMVLVGVLLLAVIAVYKDHHGDAGNTFRTVWGVGVVAMFLSLLADFVPTIAGPFAILIALGSLTHGGESGLKALLGAIVPQPPAASSPPARSGSSPPASSATPAPAAPVGG